MSEQTTFFLNHIIEAFQDHRTIPISLLNSLLGTLKEATPLAAIFRLLCLLANKKCGSSILSNQKEEIQLLGEVLLAISPIIPQTYPLKYLMTQKFNQFIQYCRDSKQQEVKNLILGSLGLYPPTSSKEIPSVFAPCIRNKPDNGNQHWVFSRYPMMQWLIIHRDKLKPQTAKVYDFLLSTKELLEEPEILTQFWNHLYALYTQLILEQHWNQAESQQQMYLTWTRIEVSEYERRLLEFQAGMKEYNLIIFHLVTSILSPFLFKKEGFQSALTSFKQYTTGINSILSILAQTFFSKIASDNNNTSVIDNLKQSVRQELRALLSHQDLQLFLPLYFSFSELKQIILDNQIDYTPFHLRPDQKDQLTLNRLLRNKINQKMLNYLGSRHLLSLFGSEQWGEVEFTKNMVEILKKYQNIFLDKLHELTKNTQLNTLKSEFALFIQIWDNYREVVQQTVPNFSILSKILNFEQQSFRTKLNFLTPKQRPQAVFFILMAYYRYFSHFKQQMKKGGTILEHFKQFHEKQMPALLPILTQQQRDEFWKSYGEMLPYCQPLIADLFKQSKSKNPI